MFLENDFFKHTPTYFLDRTVVICPVKWSVCGQLEITPLGNIQIQFKINTNNSINDTVGQITLHHCSFVVIFSET